jgi:hypothetical protein
MSKRKRQKSSNDSPFLSPLSTRICIEAPSEVGMWANEPQTVDRNKSCKIQTRGAIRRLSLDNPVRTSESQNNTTIQLKPTPEVKMHKKGENQGSRHFEGYHFNVMDENTENEGTNSKSQGFKNPLDYLKKQVDPLSDTLIPEEITWNASIPFFSHFSTTDFATAEDFTRFDFENRAKLDFFANCLLNTSGTDIDEAISLYKQIFENTQTDDAHLSEAGSCESPRRKNVKKPTRKLNLENTPVLYNSFNSTTTGFDRSGTSESTTSFRPTSLKRQTAMKMLKKAQGDVQELCKVFNQLYDALEFPDPSLTRDEMDTQAGVEREESELRENEIREDRLMESLANTQLSLKIETYKNLLSVFSPRASCVQASTPHSVSAKNGKSQK